MRSLLTLTLDVALHLAWSSVHLSYTLLLMKTGMTHAEPLSPLLQENTGIMIFADRLKKLPKHKSR